MDWHTYLKDTPALAAILVSVVIFVGYMKTRDSAFLSSFSQIQREHAETMIQLNRAHEVSREASRQVIEKNTVALNEAIEQSKEITKTMCQVGENIKLCNLARQLKKL